MDAGFADSVGLWREDKQKPKKQVMSALNSLRSNKSTYITFTAVDVEKQVPHDLFNNASVV